MTKHGNMLLLRARHVTSSVQKLLITLFSCFVFGVHSLFDFDIAINGSNGLNRWECVCPSIPVQKTISATTVCWSSCWPLARSGPWIYFTAAGHFRITPRCRFSKKHCVVVVKNGMNSSVLLKVVLLWEGIEIYVLSHLYKYAHQNDCEGVMSFLGGIAEIYLRNWY